MPLRTVLAVLTATAALTACGSSNSTADDVASGPSPAADVLDVAVGFYPYQYVTEIVGGPDVAVTNLTKPGGEPHDLELTPQQVAGLSTVDLVVYSRGFQPAVDVAVDQQAADQAFDVLTAVDLMEGEHSDHGDEGDEHADEDEHTDESEQADDTDEHAEESGQDPHVWLDPTRLATIAGAIADQLAERAPDKAEAFRSRAAALQAELTTLDDEMRTGLASCQRQEIVTSHDAFGYLAGAYGLEQVSLAGLSPDAEASPNRLAEVATFAKENNVTTIFFEELASPRVAESLAREVGAEATVLSPLEGAPQTGDYLTAMRENLSTLRAALDCA